jgi:hypothetical protein
MWRGWSVRVGTAATDRDGRRVPADRRIARRGTGRLHRIERRFASRGVHPPLPRDASQNAPLLHAGLSDACAVCGARREATLLSDACSRRRPACAIRAAAAGRTGATENGVGVLADVAASSAVLGIGRGVRSARAGAAACAGAATAASRRSSCTGGTRSSGAGGVGTSGPSSVGAGSRCGSSGAGRSGSTGRSSGTARAHAGVREATEARVARGVAVAGALLGALRAALGAAARSSQHSGANEDRQEQSTERMHARSHLSGPRFHVPIDPASVNEVRS